MHSILHITDTADPLAEKVLARAEGRVEIETISGADVPDSFDGFDALLVGDASLSRTLTDLGESGPKIVQLTRGHHKNIDAAALVASGMTVAGASPVLAPYVSRHALGLAIAASSQNGPHGEQPRSAIADIQQNWNGSFAGKTVGIVGFGRVGMAMTALWKMLGATVIYADVRTAPHGSAAVAGARRTSLDQLLSKSDIVSLHVQWGPTSNPLLMERELRLLGRDSVLINTADARLIDSEDLASSLDSGNFKAGLDAEGVGDSPLAGAPNLVWTSFSGARSEEADGLVAEFAIANIEAALTGGKPDGVVEIVDYPPIGDPSFWSSKMSPRVV